MESSRKRRTGFIKGKLVKSLYRAAAIPSAAKRTPSPTSSYNSDHDHHQGLIMNMRSPPTVYHLQLHNHQPKENLLPYNPNNNNIPDSVGFIMNQDQAAPPQKPKVSFYIPPESSSGTTTTTTTARGGRAKIDNPFGIMADESIDLKAGNYISSVQERFKLERLNSERKVSAPLQSH